MNLCISFFYQLFSKIWLEKWKIGFGLICIFRFLEVYIRRAIWEYYFLSGTRVSVKMASISQSAFHIFLTLHRFEVQKKQWKIFQHRNIWIEELNQSIKLLFYIDFWSSPQNVLKMQSQKKQKLSGQQDFSRKNFPVKAHKSRHRRIRDNCA